MSENNGKIIKVDFGSALPAPPKSIWGDCKLCLLLLTLVAFGWLSTAIWVSWTWGPPQRSDEFAARPGDEIELASRHRRRAVDAGAEDDARKRPPTLDPTHDRVVPTAAPLASPNCTGVNEPAECKRLEQLLIPESDRELIEEER